jgi:hypothetical protein
VLGGEASARRVRLAISAKKDCASFSRIRKDRKAQERRMSLQAQGGTHSIAEDISTREDRRPDGMSAEDRAWEQASLQRNQESQTKRTRRTDVTEDR